ncbi:MAG: serine hydrolase [Vicinamibacterales bacterium]
MRAVVVSSVVALSLGSVVLGRSFVGPGQAATAARPAAGTAAAYFPDKDNWQHRAPAEVGMDAALLEQAIAFAKANETTRPKDLSDQETIFGRLLGPFPKERGNTNAVIIRHGYIVAEFGETTRVDPTYSVAKSYLSTLTGLAVDRGLIKDITRPVKELIHDGGYESAHNAPITWEHHLRQTSEWEGEMWGKKHDFVGATEFGNEKREPRALQAPGSFYEYNDVRINRLSLSLLRLFKRPLPDVLKTEIMDPIGASSSWIYHGYNNSDVEVDGKTMKSVSGGTRWGGGLWMSTLDHARFGYLVLRHGRWKEKQLLSEKWLTQATTSQAVAPNAPDYGFLWWLNQKGKQWPDVPRTSFAALGAGSNTIWIDPEHDLVVVWRWHNGKQNDFYKRIIAAIKSGTAD